jgi:hypothetical protein
MATDVRVIRIRSFGVRAIAFRVIALRVIGGSFRLIGWR